MAPNAAPGELVLVINPGSTSTKIAVFDGDERVFNEQIDHSGDELAQFERIADQREYREALITASLERAGYAAGSFAAVVGRGGLLRPVVSGTYAVNEPMLVDLKAGYQGEHASNLGGVLAYDIAARAGAPSFVVDPVIVDELGPLARYSGLPEIPRRSVFHALNAKAMARRAAEELGRPLTEINLIVAHLGGGVTVSAMRGGRFIDVTNGLEEGPFTPERAGSLPTLSLLALCMSGEHDERTLRKKLVGRGGLVGYLGTNSSKEIEDRALAGDAKAKEILDAMIYQIAKEIGAMATVLKGRVDAVILTGGQAHSDYMIDALKERVGFVGRILVYAGGDEMRALALGCLRVLRGLEEARDYPQMVDGAEEGA